MRSLFSDDEMISNKLLISLFLILACYSTATVTIEAIIGGEVSDFSLFPYLVSINAHGYGHLCGGGTIADRFILTAAHCVIRSDGEFYKIGLSVLTGTNYLYQMNYPAVIVDVIKIYVPMDYNISDINNLCDIAILELEHPLGLLKHKHLKELRLPANKDETYANKTSKIAGFGWSWINIKDDEDGINKGSYLRFAHADVLPEGHPSYKRKTVAEKQIRARVKQNDHSKPRGVCNGDSGSPLVYNGSIIIGILSASPTRCSELRYGAVYTRVTYYKDFIEDVVEDKNIYSVRTHEFKL